MSEEAKKRLLQGLPFVRVALEMASLNDPTGEVGFAVIVKKPDGSGQVTSTFGREFLDDVAEVLGVKDKPMWAEAEDDSEDC